MDRKPSKVMIRISHDPRRFSEHYGWELSQSDARTVASNLTAGLTRMFHVHMNERDQHHPAVASVTTGDGDFTVRVTMPNDPEGTAREELASRIWEHIRHRVDYRRAELVDPNTDTDALGYSDLESD